jgi:predicted nucleic acid-binding protein
VRPGWLVDAGPLIALVLRGDQDHAACVEIAARLPKPLATTWPVLTEVTHVVGGYREQDAILEMVERGALELLPLDAADMPRIRALMRKYKSQPMDLADATLVRTAERDGLYQIFSLDRDFRVYRLGRGRPFTVIP